MTDLVMITESEDGQVTEPEALRWCVVISAGGSSATLCTHEVFGLGEGSAKYKTKTVKMRGVTCKACLTIIREIKALKL